MERRQVGVGIIVALLMMVAVVAVPANADTMITTASHTDPIEMMGKTQPAKDDTSVVWISGDRMYAEHADGGVLMLADKGVIYMIDNNEKSYVEIPLSEAAEAGKEAMEQMPQSGMPMMETTITPTEETKKIKDWDAQKYVMDMKIMMGTGTSEIWATKDLKVDYSQFRKLPSMMMAGMPGFEKMMAEWEKVDGAPVLVISQMSMMGATVSTRQEVLECVEKDAPEGIFELPEGYEKTEAGPMMGR